MRRKTVDENRFQALGTKNEKNLGSGQLPTYMDIDTCSLPKKSVVGEASVRKKAASLPKTILNDKASARFNALH